VVEEAVGLGAVVVSFLRDIVLDHTTKAHSGHAQCSGAGHVGATQIADVHDPDRVVDAQPRKAVPKDRRIRLVDAHLVRERAVTDVVEQPMVLEVATQVAAASQRGVADQADPEPGPGQGRHRDHPTIDGIHLEPV
jgi:hypothetical protein